MQYSGEGLQTNYEEAINTFNSIVETESDVPEDIYVVYAYDGEVLLSW